MKDIGIVPFVCFPRIPLMAIRTDFNNAKRILVLMWLITSLYASCRLVEIISARRL